MANKVNVKRFLSLSGAMLVLVGSLTACGKKAECNVGGSHAHLYKNDEGYIRYIDKEYLSYDGYLRNEEYIDIEGQEDLYKFLRKKELMRIDDNLEVIKKAQEKQIDYIIDSDRYL